MLPVKKIFPRGVIGGLCLILCCIGISFAVVIAQARRELSVLEVKQSGFRAELAHKTQAYQQQHAYLKKLLNDKQFFEKVLRERLGYSRENEVIFRFPDKNTR